MVPAVHGNHVVFEHRNVRSTSSFASFQKIGVVVKALLAEEPFLLFHLHNVIKLFLADIVLENFVG
jgi:hypothetical protein